MDKPDKTYDIEENACVYTKKIINDKIFVYNLEAEDAMKMLKDTESYHYFGDSLRTFLKQWGYSGSIESVSEMRDYIILAFNKIEKDIVSSKTIERWLKNESRPNNHSRETIFKLMFAMNSTLEQMISFFLKAYYEQPFNFKNSNECIYYWCLKNNKNWLDVVSMKEQLKEMKDIIKNTECFDEQTIMIGKSLDEMQNEKEVVSYIVNNLNGEEIYFHTAREKFSELLKESKEIASKIDMDTIVECKQDSFKNHRQTNSVDYLLAVIFENRNGIKPSKEWPSLIKENFPTKMQFSRCFDDDEKNPDILRKSMILLMFFISFYDENDIKEFDDFYDIVNYNLEICGFPLLYPANPYDRIFLTSAFTDNPLSYFRNAFSIDEE